MKSGKLLIRIPKSVHAALEHKARHEGVSMNQLIVSILSASLADYCRGVNAAANRKDQP